MTAVSSRLCKDRTGALRSRGFGRFHIFELAETRRRVLTKLLLGYSERLPLRAHALADVLVDRARASWGKLLRFCLLQFLSPVTT